MRADQLRLGKRTARGLPQPKVQRVGGVNVVTQQLDGLGHRELLALSEFYRWKYGTKDAA